MINPERENHRVGFGHGVYNINNTNKVQAQPLIYYICTYNKNNSDHNSLGIGVQGLMRIREFK